MAKKSIDKERADAKEKKLGILKEHNEKREKKQPIDKSTEAKRLGIEEFNFFNYLDEMEENLDMQRILLQ